MLKCEVVDNSFNFLKLKKNSFNLRSRIVWSFSGNLVLSPSMMSPASMMGFSVKSIPYETLRSFRRIWYSRRFDVRLKDKKGDKRELVGASAYFRNNLEN